MEKLNQPLMGRRNFIRVASLASAGALALTRVGLAAGLESGGAGERTIWPLPSREFPLSSASGAAGPGAEARKLLAEGNKRYVECEALGLNRGPRRREEQAPHQTPFAAILSCIDSRVPPEIIFDRGIGDLFVVRTAGQVLDSAAIGSLEFAVKVYHVPLIMVLGHQNCGAVSSTIEYVDTGKLPPGNIAYIVKQIKDAVPPPSTPDRLNVAIRRNVEMIIPSLRRQSPIIDTAIRENHLEIVGAKCELKSAEVNVIFG